MTALYIILGILLFLLLLLLVPVKLCIVYNDDWTMKIKYMFFSFGVFPPKPKKPKKKKTKPKAGKKAESKEEKPKKEKSPTAEFLKQKGLSGLLTLFSDIIKLMTQASKRILRHLLFYRLNVKAAIAGEDAAETAMQYGYACSAVYPAVSFIDSHAKKCNYKLDIAPDFDGEKTEIDCDMIVGIRPLFVIAAAIPLIWGGLKLIVKNTK